MEHSGRMDQQQQRRSSNEMELSQLAHDMNANLNTRQLVPQIGRFGATNRLHPGA